MVDDGRRFAFKRCLGSGGFGEVYLASMTSASGVETEVAVKLLHDGLDPRSQAVQRLRDEGRLLGTLNHPSVLKVHDLVLIDDRVALVMEYVPGLDLEQCVELPHPIGLRAGLEVTAFVADALLVAYDSPGPDGTPLRLVHRDIKPPNIRIGLHGEVKVLDFGIAKAADARREAKTQTAVMMGSPWYMAPERFDGKKAGPPADVYALGCSLYEVAARGGRLFSELSSREHFLLALDGQGHDDHIREHLAPLQIPADLRWMLDRMLAYRPEDRPSHQEVSDQAERLAEELGGETLRRWCKSLDWPDLPALEGLLVGRTITEARLSSFSPTEPEVSAPPVVQAPPRPLSEAKKLEPAKRSLPTFDGDDLDGLAAQLPAKPTAPSRPVLPASTRRRSTPPPAPIKTRRTGAPIPTANRLIVPSVIGSIAIVSGLSFAFFMVLCFGIMALG